jgi:hypothetical protein
LQTNFFLYRNDKADGGDERNNKRRRLVRHLIE